MDIPVIPSHCPVSDKVWDGLGERLRTTLRAMNDARLGGDVAVLERELARTRGWVETGRYPKDAESERLPIDAAVHAALGYCLSILGRWCGSESMLEQGVNRINRFVSLAEDCDLEDGEETRVRAIAYLGNAITRQAYVNHDHALLRKACSEFLTEEHPCFEKHPVLHASILRDRGDALLGRLFWDDDGVLIDGDAINTLKDASQRFYEQWESKGKDFIEDEWAAAESSLAVALARSARRIRNGTRTPQTFLGSLTVEQKIAALIAEAEKVCERVWRAYLRRCESGSPSFRWARTGSNVAFSSLETFLLNRDRLPAAMLAETAFHAVLGVEQGASLFEQESGTPWYTRKPQNGAHYTWEAHRGRFTVNVDGLRELRDAVPVCDDE